MLGFGRAFSNVDIVAGSQLNAVDSVVVSFCEYKQRVVTLLYRINSKKNHREEIVEREKESKKRRKCFHLRYYGMTVVSTGLRWC